MIGKIYKITNNINQKVYIGQTITTLQNRFRLHCSKWGIDFRNMAIQKAIQKYGKENFKIELIELIENCSKETLNEREIYWINYYDSYKNGYNCTAGGSNMSHKRKLSDLDIKDICIAYSNGVKMKEICNTYNIAKNTVLKYLKLNNMQINNLILENRVDLDLFVNFIKENNPTIREVKDKFNICKCSIYNILKLLNDDSLKLKPIKREPKTIDDIDKNLLLQLYFDGKSIRELVKIFHVRKNRISEYLHSLNINPRKHKNNNRI